jgi:hypothetical protein
MEIGKGSTRSYSVENWLWKRLWTCCKTSRSGWMDGWWMNERMVPGDLPRTCTNVHVLFYLFRKAEGDVSLPHTTGKTSVLFPKIFGRKDNADEQMANKGHNIVSLLYTALKFPLYIFYILTWPNDCIKKKPKHVVLAYIFPLYFSEHVAVTEVPPFRRHTHPPHTKRIQQNSKNDVRMRRTAMCKTL